MGKNYWLLMPMRSYKYWEFWVNIKLEMLFHGGKVLVFVQG